MPRGKVQTNKNPYVYCSNQYKSNITKWADNITMKDEVAQNLSKTVLRTLHGEPH